MTTSFFTRFASLLFLTFVLTNCVYHAEEVLYPSEPEPEPVIDTCNIPSVVSYDRDVEPLLVKHYCVACHENADPAGGITLEGYGRVTPYIENGSLLGSIRYEQGFDPMPKGYPRMPDCEVEMIRVWIEQGYPNN
ncbi:MAG: hypothetical protein NWR72_17005 [Bacteroidia bacterium]|nr:hypothetical protein [Bacteroidia bacterium]